MPGLCSEGQTASSTTGGAVVRVVEDAVGGGGGAAVVAGAVVLAVVVVAGVEVVVTSGVVVAVVVGAVVVSRAVDPGVAALLEDDPHPAAVIPARARSAMAAGRRTGAQGTRVARCRRSATSSPTSSQTGRWPGTSWRSSRTVARPTTRRCRRSRGS